MNRKSTNILNSFIKLPDLKITSETYPFQYFDFLEEEILESDFCFPQNLILGLQAESCFQAYLNHSKNYKLLASNIQIYTRPENDLKNIDVLNTSQQRETLGELDFVAKNLLTDKIIHIELACKFYLYDINSGSVEEEKWIGPNRKDRLSEKLKKIKNKQFPILNTPEAFQQLNAKNVEFPTNQFLCLKALLFIPKELDALKFSVNYQNCIVGYWITAADFNNEDKNALYALPNKREWLLPYTEISEWQSYRNIKNEISKVLKSRKSPLVYRKQPNQIDIFFVVWW